jgi:hypothetical protein
MTDTARAQRNVRQNLESDLADDAVTLGLADDYFRLLRNKIEQNWLPAQKDLNDGGDSVSRLSFMTGAVSDVSAWQEMWSAYTDLASQYANGQQPTLAPARKTRLIELMRSRKGMFRVHAIAELTLQQNKDGGIVFLELTRSTNHPHVDEGIRTALQRAVEAMEEKPSARMTKGKSFTSSWRLRATWSMVPPTAFFSGAAFDITPKGLSVDVPFDITLKTNVMLQRTSTTASVSAAGSDE